MANTYLTIGQVTREALMVLENNLVAAKNVSREYEDKFAVSGAKIGQVLNIRRPPRYMTAVGQALQIEDATETSVPLVLNTQRHLGLAFSSQDLTLNIDDFSKRFVRPGLATLANFIDFDLLGQYLNISNEIGTPGTVPNQALTYLQVGQRLSEEAVPFDDRCLIISPAMNATIVDALKGLFQDGSKIKEQYDKGQMGGGLGFDWYLDQNVRVQTVGALGGSGTINGANQTGSSIVTNGWSNSITNLLLAGDIITFAGSNAVNPQNRQSTGALRQWVVTANVSSDGSGNATIPIAGPSGNGLIVAGPWQNVDKSPANAAAIVVQGAANTKSPRGLAFHRDAFTLATADLVLPDGVDMRDRQNYKGISLRIIRAYDINQDRFPFRADVLYGIATLYPELACRIAS